MTNTGVPYCAARSVTGTPAIDTTPSAPRTALRGQTFGASVSTSAARLRPRRGAAVVDLLGVPGPGGMRVHIRSGALTPRMPQSVGDDLAGGLRTAPAARRAARPAPRHPAAARGRSRRTGDSRRPGPRGSAQPGAAHAGPRRFSARAGTRRCCGSACPPCRASSRSRCAVSGGDARVRRRCGPAPRAGRARIARSRPGSRWTPMDHSCQVDVDRGVHRATGSARTGRRRRRWPRRGRRG